MSVRFSLVFRSAAVFWFGLRSAYPCCVRPREQDLEEAIKQARAIAPRTAGDFALTFPSTVGGKSCREIEIQAARVGTVPRTAGLEDVLGVWNV